MGRTPRQYGGVLHRLILPNQDHGISLQMRTSTCQWLDHYASVTSSPPDTMLGTLDPALVPIEITPQEKRELTDFLLSLSSAYASAWTQKPATLHGTPEP